MNENEAPVPPARASGRGGDGADLVERLARAQQFGPVAALPDGNGTSVLVTGPDAVQHVLAKRTDRYGKRLTRTRFLMGEGVVAATGDTWKRQRRLLQPHFTARAIGTYDEAMHAAADAVADLWAQSAADGRPRDVAADMRHYALDVIWRCLTGRPGDEDTYRDLDAVNTIFASVPALPTGDPAADPVIAAHVATVHAVIDRAIDEADRTGSAPWLLPTLLRAGDLPERIVRDEALNLVAAGHETSAHALAWVFVLLDGHPRVLAEVRSAGAPGSPARLAALRAVVSEAVRLYPVAWLLRRHAFADDTLCGHRIPIGATVLISPYLTHRDPALWPDPQRFDPGRFTDSGHRPAHPAAYFPFGFGPRACLGAQFAVREMTIVLDRLLARFTPALHRTPSAHFGLTIRPDGPVTATIGVTGEG
ncbi:cytochrome P450 [Streptomyces sp. NPDC047315]|uniref:cytochrome P450 n=1 Tax=Streptomyces sp. NPDC047315 TaxID=3155142 RepID=UPI0034041F89